MESNLTQMAWSKANTEDEINVFDWILALLRRKRMIILSTLAISVMCFVAFSFVVSPIFVGTAKILPPQSTSSSTAQMLSQLSGAAGGAITAIMGGNTSSDLYVGLLQCRTILDAIIQQFGLLEQYKADRFLGSLLTYTIDDTRSQLVDNLSVTTDSTSGIITVTVEDKDPKKAAEMANGFISELKKLMRRLAVTDSGRARLFFEQEIEKTHEALSKAEENLAQFQTASGAIELDVQASAMLSGISALAAQVAAKEMQLQVMRSFSTDYNPDFKRAQEELSALRTQLKKAESKEGKQYSSSFLPTTDIPSLGTEYLRRMREFKFQETLYELLVKQYEVARLDEARDSALIQQVDDAIPPVNKTKPQPILFTILLGGVSFFFSVALAFVLQGIEKSRLNPSHSGKWSELIRNVKSI